MKLPFVVLTAAALAAGISYAADPKPLATQKEKASYGIGMNVAKRFKHDLIDLDIDAFMRGFRDVLTDAKPAVSEAELDEALESLRQEIEAKAVEAGAQAKKTGEDFLAKNKEKPGVKTTASGLQYKIIEAGTGPSPKPSDTVKVHYKGTLIDGTVFDSSYDRGEPITFPVTGVIAGWTEALQMMKVGGKWQLFIPSDLAYGDRGTGPIPPGSTLIFEVELLGIE